MFMDAVADDAATGALAEYYRRLRAAWAFLPNYARAFSTDQRWLRRGTL